VKVPFKSIKKWRSYGRKTIPVILWPFFGTTWTHRTPSWLQNSLILHHKSSLRNLFVSWHSGLGKTSEHIDCR